MLFRFSAHLQISLHLSIGGAEKELACTSVAETTCAYVNVVKTSQLVYLGRNRIIELWQNAPAAAAAAVHMN